MLRATINPSYKTGLIHVQLHKGCLVRQGSIVLANILWIHVNYCHKGAVACFYQEGGCNWNNVLSPNKWTCITGRAYKVFHLM